MKLRATFFVILLVASLFAAVFTLRDVHGQQPQYGPNIDHIKFTVIKGHAAVEAMLARQIDILTDLTYPRDIEVLSRAGRKIISMPDDNFYYVGFNMRPYRPGVPPKALPFGLQSGGNPGLALRHAIAHLIPKAMLIGSLFGYVCTQIEVPMSASLGTFGADIDTHPYSPTMARNILLAGGWTWDGSNWHVPAVVPPEYPLPPGSVLPTIEFMSLTMEASLASWTIVETTRLKMIEIGMSVDHVEYELPMLIDKIDARDYEMYFFYEEDMGRFGAHLYDFFHSANDIPGGYNRPGLHNDTLDAALWALYSALDQAHMHEKVAESLELLMGTSAYQNTVNTDGLIPYVPIYSRTHHDAYDEYLYGIVNAKLKGSWNYWTACNLDWLPGHERASDLIPPLPEGNNMVIFCWGDDPQYPANPASVSSTVTWDMLDYIYEGLIGMSPYNLKDKPGWLDLTRDPDPFSTPGYYIVPWIVPDGPAAGRTGMKVTFYLNTTITRDWHDGHNWDEYDVAFAWEYLTANKIPRAWNTFKYFHHCTIEDASTITAYMTTTSLVLPYGLSEWSSMFPEHVWGCCQATPRGGRATPSCVWASRKDAWDAQLSWINSGASPGTAGTKPATDPDATAESGLCLCAESGSIGVGGKLTCIHDSGCVIDNRMTAINEILDYDPSAYAWAISEYPWLTEQTGTGPFVFYQINVTAGRGDLIAFDARTQAPVPTIGVHYPKTTNEIHNEKVEMFWELGDVDLNGEIRVVYDLAIMGAWFFHPVPPAPWRADVYRDYFIDTKDLTIAGRNYGEVREIDP